MFIFPESQQRHPTARCAHSNPPNSVRKQNFCPTICCMTSRNSTLRPKLEHKYFKFSAFHLFTSRFSDAPVCRPGLPPSYSVDRGEIADIRCETESNPPATGFRWKFNSLVGGVRELEANDDVNNAHEFKPQNENDYGTVLCWGLNSIGMQTEPCVFQVVPAGKPEPLTNCTVVNQTQHSFQVTCIEGYDGGHPQDFIAELYHAREKFSSNSISSR